MVCNDGRLKTLGPVTVKAENPQVGRRVKIVYRMYRLLRLTLKSASYKRHRKKTVHPVQKPIRFDNEAQEVA